MSTNMGKEYICTHLGEEESHNLHYGAVIPPIFETSLHVFESMHAMVNSNGSEPGKRYVYGRVDNPTTNLLEAKLAALEGADDCACFASGMAAISSAILYCIKPGGHIVAVNNCYGPARTFMSNYLKDQGVEITYVQGSDPADFEGAIRANTQMFYLESPTSGVMEIQNLSAVAGIAKAHGIKTIIDNTWATPIFQNPLALGIDITVHTMSKYIGGHSDVIGGALCANKEIVTSIKRNERELLGGIIGPFEAWLCIRGLRTMPLRLRQSGANAQLVAERLEKHPRTLRVNYPGLASHPQHALAMQQMSGCSGLLSVALDAPRERVVQAADQMTLFRKGVSWGGFESLCCMVMYGLTEEQAKERNGCPQLIRLYCGVEDGQELLQDIDRLLAAL